VTVPTVREACWDIIDMMSASDGLLGDADRAGVPVFSREELTRMLAGLTDVRQALEAVMDHAGTRHDPLADLGACDATLLSHPRHQGQD
jgi:hypothetical protein